MKLETILMPEPILTQFYEQFNRIADEISVLTELPVHAVVVEPFWVDRIEKVSDTPSRLHVSVVWDSQPRTSYCQLTIPLSMFRKEEYDAPKFIAEKSVKYINRFFKQQRLLWCALCHEHGDHNSETCPIHLRSFDVS